jgi:hypothetical protein
MVEVFTVSHHVGKVRGGGVKWRVMHNKWLPDDYPLFSWAFYFLVGGQGQ